MEIRLLVLMMLNVLLLGNALQMNESSPIRHEGRATSTSDCLTNSLDNSIFCRGSRVMRNIIRNLSKTDKPIVLVRGLEIVPSREQLNASGTSAVGANVDPAPDTSVLEYFSDYLRSHELNIKFSDLMADDSEQYLSRNLEQRFPGISEGRKKDKGQGIALAMALMFGKMMAVMGLGGVGALALKALGVAMAALMLAGIVALKALASQGHESSHSVSYVAADGHHHHKRRRRSAGQNLAYGGWSAVMRKN